MNSNMMYTNAATTTRIELPEFFVNLLQEHGIDLNATPKTLKGAWIKWIYTRNYTFNQVNEWYHKIQARLKEAQETIEWQNHTLNHYWGISVSVPLDLSLLDSTDWSVPANAIPALKRVYELLPTREKICEMAKEAETTAREAWVKEIMETARERGATYLVFKTGYKPYDHNAEKFENSVRERKPCSIRMMCIGLEWLACSIDDAEDILLNDLGRSSLSKLSCKTIDYIVS